MGTHTQVSLNRAGLAQLEQGARHLFVEGDFLGALAVIEARSHFGPTIEMLALRSACRAELGDVAAATRDAATLREAIDASRLSAEARVAAAQLVSRIALWRPTQAAGASGKDDRREAKSERWVPRPKQSNR